MKNKDSDNSKYDPRDYRSDMSGVYSSFALFALVMVGLFIF